MTLYLDIEADGDKLLCVGYAVDDAPVVVSTVVTPEVARLLADPAVVKVTQSSYDLRFLKLAGWEVAGPWHDTKVMAWVLDENQPLDLGALTMRYLDPSLVKTRRITQRAGTLYFDRVHALSDFYHWPEYVVKDFLEYNRFDVHTLRALYKELRKGLEVMEFEDYWLREEVPYSSALLNMETRGLPVDLGATKALAAEVRQERDTSAARLRRWAGLPSAFNLDSPKQLSQYLFTRYFALPAALPMNTDPLPGDWEFEVRKVGRDYIHGVWLLKGLGLAPTQPAQKKGQDSTSADPSTASPELLFKHPNVPFVQELCLVYRRADKLLNTYLEKFPKIAVEVEEKEPQVPASGGKGAAPAAPASTRIFGRYNQTGTVTGRLSSSEPNLQNIPARRERGKQVRALFKGRFVIGDYDALEMRLMAHMSQDPSLMRCFVEGRDPHELTASVLGVDRDAGKTMNYAIGYGAGPKRLAQTLTLAGYPTTFGEAKQHLEAVKSAYPRLFRWMTHIMFEAKEHGGVNTIGGRRRHLATTFRDAASWKEMQYGERQAVNTVVQGSAADVFRRTLIKADREIPMLRLLAQVHDEAVWEYDEPKHPKFKYELELLQYIMEKEHCFALRVPLVFVPTVCQTWADKGGEVDGIEEERD